MYGFIPISEVKARTTKCLSTRKLAASCVRQRKDWESKQASKIAKSGQLTQPTFSAEALAPVYSIILVISYTAKEQKHPCLNFNAVYSIQKRSLSLGNQLTLAGYEANGFTKCDAFYDNGALKTHRTTEGAHKAQV